MWFRTTSTLRDPASVEDLPAVRPVVPGTGGRPIGAVAGSPFVFMIGPHIR
jgi:hypothetical protein